MLCCLLSLHHAIPFEGGLGLELQPHIIVIAKVRKELLLSGGCL